VLAAAAPGVTIIDLTHHVPAFDVRAGAQTLLRAAPHLGAGVVLAVVDPGVGSARRGLCLPVWSPGEPPTFFVGPDNGLLIAAAEQVGGGAVARVFALHDGARRAGTGRTFDGRDLFAPVAAALCRGVPPSDVGEPVDPRSLVRLPEGVVERGRLGDGRPYVRAELTWVDRFGNAQLAATSGETVRAGLPVAGAVFVSVPGGDEPATVLRRVDTFADLAHGELGLLVDANGHVAVVAGEGSAAELLHLHEGQVVTLTW
jgi:S-adenosyl-L-methionine hydrolase (adenosine-forming)